MLISNSFVRGCNRSYAKRARITRQILWALTFLTLWVTSRSVCLESLVFCMFPAIRPICPQEAELVDYLLDFRAYRDGRFVTSRERVNFLDTQGSICDS